MFKSKFLSRQRKRIRSRITACELSIQRGRIDAVFKATRVLPAQRLALERLRTGLYGQCIGCSCPIGKRRLRAIPAAIRCMSCQKEAES